MALKPEKNATKGKDSNKRDYPNGNTRDNSKTHLKNQVEEETLEEETMEVVDKKYKREQSSLFYFYNFIQYDFYNF